MLGEECADTAADAWKALLDHILAQDFCSNSNGHCTSPHATKPPFVYLYSICFFVFYLHPIGIAIGIIIDSTTADWIYAISMGIATGVFVYVAVNHLIAKG